MQDNRLAQHNLQRLRHNQKSDWRLIVMRQIPLLVGGVPEGRGGS